MSAKTLLAAAASAAALALALATGAHAQTYPIPATLQGNEVIICTQTGTPSACTPSLLLGYGLSRANTWTALQTFSGGFAAIATSSGGSGSANTINSLAVTSDTYNAGLYSNIGWEHLDTFGSSSAYGGRVGLDAHLILGSALGATNSNNQNRNYYGSQSIFEAQTSDGGVNGFNKGNGVGSVSLCQLDNTAVYFNYCTGAQASASVQTGSSVLFKSLLTVDSLGTDGGQGSAVDTMVWLYDQAGAVGHNYGLLFGTGGGPNQWPIRSTGTMIGANGGAPAAADGVDFSAVTFSDCAFKSTGFCVKPTGQVSTPSIIGMTTPLSQGQGGTGNALGFASNCYEIEAFGGKGDGSTLNDTAFANALAASTGAQKCVRFGPGTFKFSTTPATIALTAGQELLIGGASGGITNLLFPAGAKGFLITEADNTSSVHFRDLTFQTQDAAGAATYAIRVNQLSNLSGVSTKRSDFANLLFRGADGLEATDYWANALIQNASNFQYTNFFVYGSSTAQGNGISLLGNGTGAGQIAVVSDITDSGFYNTGNGLIYGNYFQGVQIKGTNFVGCYTGINEPGSQSSNAELAITNSQFDCAYDIDLESGMVGTLIENNYFIARGNETAVTLKGLYDFVVHGNYFENDWATTPTSSVAINVSSWAPGTEGNSAGWGVINGNIFNAYWNGITLASTSQHVVVGPNNAFDQIQGTAITNTGTNNCVGVCSAAITGGTISSAAISGGTISGAAISSSSITSTALGTLYNTNSVSFGSGAGMGTTGGTVPACNTGTPGHVCDSLSGEVVLTTGTNANSQTGENLVAYVSLPTHTNKYNCVVNAYAVGDATYRGWRILTDTSHLYVYENVALANSTAYYIDYVCGGQ